MNQGNHPKLNRFRRSWIPSAAIPTGFAAVLILFMMMVTSESPGQSSVLGDATDFTSDQYFEPPNQQKVKMRLSGSSASPLPGGKLNVTNLKIENYGLNGKTNMIVRAPQCLYAPYDGVASSDGHLELESGDGKIRITGDGFLWQQSDDSLTISNNVHTVIQMKVMQLNLP